MDSELLLQGYSLPEKEAYLGAIASIATVDRKATEDELEYLSALAEAAGVDQEIVRASALDASNEIAGQHLMYLKNSELKYSLITDILSFAKADGKLTPEEQERINEISNYLEITPQQTQALGSFVEKSAGVKPEEGQLNEGFLERNGLTGMLQKAGIPTESILKGLLGIAAPMILSRMLRGRQGSQQSSGGGLLGSVLGGSGGGLLGGLLGGKSGYSSGMGGLGSILGNLSGGRGYGGLGSLLGGILQKR